VISFLLRTEEGVFSQGGVRFDISLLSRPREGGGIPELSCRGGKKGGGKEKKARTSLSFADKT